MFAERFGFGHIRQVGLTDLNDLGVLLHVVKVAGIICYGYVALRLAISLTLCRTSSLVFCAAMPSATIPLFRLISVFLFRTIWSLAVGLAARNTYSSTPRFAFRLVY